MTLADQLENDIPYLRRYARALTGSQTEGDQLALDALSRVIDARSNLDSVLSVRANLFRIFHENWSARRETGGETRHAVPENAREVVLLSTMERFSTDEIAAILGLPEALVKDLLRNGPTEMQRGKGGRIQVIEDDAMITNDLSRILHGVGHQVIGEARTHAEAIAQAAKTQPDLILTDIELADGSSGINAVRDILTAMGSVPVVFVTAYPERLLTGSRPEPVFLVTKPFTEMDIVTAVAQALFLATTDGLRPAVN